MIDIDKIVLCMQVGLPLLLYVFIISLCVMCLIWLDSVQKRMRRKGVKRHGTGGK